MNVKQICNTIKNVAQKITRNAVPSIPAIVMLCSLAKRPGLSTIVSVINITQQLKKHGISTAANRDGSPNHNVLMTYAIVDELYRALREDANIQGAGAPSALSILSTGASPAGPVTLNGTNLLPFKIIGQMF